MNLAGHNIIVTGASQGIGAEVSRQIVALGGKAIMVDVQGDKLEEIAGDIGGSVET
ncbi:MAG: SDR family NAD(P)-dependent oxidoreductase, partial [Pseudomonadota bacterium]